jgi:ribosomal protein S18 acetylase RimI-like enzyme
MSSSINDCVLVPNIIIGTKTSSRNNSYLHRRRRKKNLRSSNDRRTSSADSGSINAAVNSSSDDAFIDASNSLRAETGADRSTASAAEDTVTPVKPTVRAKHKERSVGPTPVLIVDLEKGTVKIQKSKRKEKTRMDSALEQAVKKREIQLKDLGQVKISQLDEDDCMDATNLVMDLFFKVRPQDFLRRKRLAKEQTERVYKGLLDGVLNATDRVLIAAKVGGNLVGIAEVSMPNGQRFGAENYRPKAPKDKPYLSDVAVAKTQRGRGIGKALVIAAEDTMRELGETVMYTHTKVDNKGALTLFEKCGYVEPDWAKKTLTQAQISQRGSSDFNPFAAVGLVEVGHFMLEKQLRR